MPPVAGSIRSWWNSFGGCPSSCTISGAKIATSDQEDHEERRRRARPCRACSRRQAIWPSERPSMTGPEPTSSCSVGAPPAPGSTSRGVLTRWDSSGRRVGARANGACRDALGAPIGQRRPTWRRSQATNPPCCAIVTLVEQRRHMSAGSAQDKVKVVLVGPVNRRARRRGGVAASASGPHRRNRPAGWPRRPPRRGTWRRLRPAPGPRP